MLKTIESNEDVFYTDSIVLFTDSHPTLVGMPIEPHTKLLIYERLRAETV